MNEYEKKYKDLLKRHETLLNMQTKPDGIKSQSTGDKIIFIRQRKNAFRNIERCSSDFSSKQHFIQHRRDKGGRSRFSPIIGLYQDKIIERFQKTPNDGKVWGHVPKNADIHSYRADYCLDLYKEYARDIKDIPYDKYNPGLDRWYQSDVYACRKDEAGKKLDRQAMLKCSKALGHNRVEVVASNYVRGL